MYLTNSQSWSSGYVLSLAPTLGVDAMFEFGGGGGTRQTVTGFLLFTDWDKEADFFFSLNWTF